MSGYVMDNREFPLDEDIENKKIVIMKKKGIPFYISKEGKSFKNTFVIFSSKNDKKCWFDESDFPDIFESVEKIYNDLGEINFYLYGYRDLEENGNISFFDLKINLSCTEEKFFYHDDFLLICNNYAIPVCETYLNGSFSLKTLNKTLINLGIDKNNLLFKPVNEEIIKVYKTKEYYKPFNNKVVNFKNKQKNEIKLSELRKLEIIEEDGFTINHDSIIEYFDFLSKPIYDEKLEELVLSSGYSFLETDKYIVLKLLREKFSSIISNIAYKQIQKRKINNIPTIESLKLEIERELYQDILTLYYRLKTDIEKINDDICSYYNNGYYD